MWLQCTYPHKWCNARYNIWSLYSELPTHLRSHKTCISVCVFMRVGVDYNECTLDVYVCVSYLVRVWAARTAARIVPLVGTAWRSEAQRRAERTRGRRCPKWSATEQCTSPRTGSEAKHFNIETNNYYTATAMRIVAAYVSDEHQTWSRSLQSYRNVGVCRF